MMEQTEVLSKEEIKGRRPCCWCIGTLDHVGKPVALGKMKVEWSEKDANEIVKELNEAIRPITGLKEGPFIVLECYLVPKKKKAPKGKRSSRRVKK